MEARPVKIYTTEDVPRLQYIAGLVLGEILGLTWEVITDKRKLGKYTVINYSSEDIPGSFKITPNTLLFEKGIQQQEILVTDWGGLPVFFATSPDSDIPFDLFAASFFLVSRYEEYLDFEPDQFGRFAATSSVAYKNGFLGIPVIDLWAKELARALLNKFHYLAFKRNQYDVLLTIDVDQPFAYLGKSLMRSIGGLFRDMKNGSENVSERYRIVAKGEKDPFEVFDYIIDNIEKEEVDCRFFFPVGDHSEYDKNPSWRNEKYRKLIQNIADKFEIGLHPSFYASGDHKKVKDEAVRLNKILAKEVLLSRFHFIRLFIPQSYRDIYNTGILEDYSMGYPDEPGFRAGIARPFNFYDVLQDQKTNLKIIPFMVMDVTLYNYKKLDHIASKEVILRLLQETKKVGGLFVSIWHNTSLLDNQEWKGWRDLFEFMLKNQNNDSVSQK